ncbi:hypothetical protein GGR56DRAFT_643935 [Xylariaceae sp. FL0804]|nr:hypothetical protein GGR56DRAFT_643935 [Xylariaceae sp. FL0804]
MIMSSPTKRFRSSPTPHKSLCSPPLCSPTPQGSWRGHHRQLIQSSPIKPRRQQHFTTSAGPDVSFFQGTRRPSADLTSTPNLAAQSDDDDDLLPAHSFQVNGNGGASPPRTPPPMRSRRQIRDRNDAGGEDDDGHKTGEEGADLLLYLAASPSPAMPSRTRMEPPSTPPPKRGGDMALPSSMMTTPGGGSSLFPSTPGQPFDFSDYVNITPSPAQKPWKTPLALSSAANKTPTGRTPLSLARRRLTFDEPLGHGLS